MIVHNCFIIQTSDALLLRIAFAFDGWNERAVPRCSNRSIAIDDARRDEDEELGAVVDFRSALEQVAQDGDGSKEGYARHRL